MNRNTNSCLLAMTLTFVMLTLSHFETTAEAAAQVAGQAMSPGAAGEPKIFRFTIPVAPFSLEPTGIGVHEASYLFKNIYRGLYSYSRKTGLAPEGAKSCQWLGLTLKCHLNPKFRWSNGREVVAADYLRAFQKLVTPGAKSSGVELLKHVLNAKEIYTGKLPLEKLGVQAQSKLVLELKFQTKDVDFLYKLTNPILTPLPAEGYPTLEEAEKLGDKLLERMVVTGPFRLAQYIKNRRFILKPNPLYLNPPQSDLQVEALVVEDDQTALTLFEAKQIEFLRRLPTQQIETYRKNPGFVQIPMARFDYIGFGPDLNDSRELRQALSLSLNYEDFSRLLHALGRPGCPSLPPSYMDKMVCFDFKNSEAQKIYAGVNASMKDKLWNFSFSKLGGDDVKASAEWIQAEWKKNLGFKVQLEQLEQGVYLQNLRSRPPPLFRKGVALDRPTCLAALETFAEGGSENFLAVSKDQKYKVILDQLRATENPKEKKKLCRQGVEVLMSNHYFIPLGEIHFTLLVSPEFSGWDLNELNQLDLSRLRSK